MAQGIKAQGKASNVAVMVLAQHARRYPFSFFAILFFFFFFFSFFFFYQNDH